MLEFSDAFLMHNFATTNEPCFVWEQSFNAANSDLVYLTSHSWARTPDNAVVYPEVLGRPSGTTQKLNPLAANSTIGNLSVPIIDLNEDITTLIATKLTAGKSLRGKRARLYVGYRGLEWADYQLVPGGTQLVNGNPTYDATPGSDAETLTLRASDIQRSTRKDIFAPTQTNITASLLGPGETGYSSTGNTVNVGSTTGFSTVARGTSYDEGAGTEVYTFSVEDEFMTATGKNSTQFTGVTRGVLGTLPTAHKITSGADSSRQPKVTTVVYYEMPALKLLYALLTGTLYNQSGKTLPTADHLAISTDYIDTASFVSTYYDLYNSADDTKGQPLRFVGTGRVDAKKFIEEQILLPLGCYLVVTSTGKLSLRRMSGIVTRASYVAVLDETNIVDYGPIEYAFEEVANGVIVKWNYEQRFKTTTRTAVLIDAVSAAADKHGASPPRTLTFNGVYGNWYTDAMVGSIFDSIIDRYSNPPYKIRATLMPWMNALEIGDIVRMTLPSLRDPTTNTGMDRAWEVQQLTVDWVTGNVVADLFASTAPGQVIVRTTNGSDLSNAWYISEGTAVTSPVSANTTWDGSAGKIIKYCDGNLTINNGVTVTIKGDVELRVKGTWTNNGIIDGEGQGYAGAAAAAYATAGYFDVRAWGGTIVNTFFYDRVSTITIKNRPGTEILRSTKGTIAVGAKSTVELFALQNDAGTLRGLASVSLKGSGGAGGGNIYHKERSATSLTLGATGGAGGAGGAGFVVVARGFAKGVSAQIKLSGLVGVQGGVWTYAPAPSRTWSYHAGSGSGGANGVFLAVVDGNTINVPDSTWLTAVGEVCGPQLGDIAYAEVAPEQGIKPGSIHPGYKGILTAEDRADFSGPSAFRLQRVPPLQAIETDVSPIAPIPSALGIVETTNLPQTLAEDQATLTLTVTPPGASNYAYSNIYGKLSTATDYEYLGPARNVFTYRTTMDGATYNFIAKPVSVAGVESTDGKTANVTMSNQRSGVTLPASGWLAIGKASYADTVAGMWFGNAAGVTQINIGNAAQSINWNGTTLAVTGTITATVGVIGGWTLAATYLTSGSGSTTVRLDSGGSNPAISAGHATPASAPFRVYSDGSFFATNATITGTVTATAGAVGGWTLAATSLISGSGANTVGLDSGGTNPAVYAGSTTPGAAPFRVTQAGAMTATAGAIGGWTLGATTLTGGGLVMDSANTRLRATSGSSYVELSATSLKGYSNALGITTFEIPANGDPPTFAGGVISTTIFNVSSTGVMRTSSTVGDGSASSAGVVVNNTGIKGFPANSSTASFHLDAATGLITATGATISGHISSSSFQSSTMYSNATHLTSAASAADTTLNVKDTSAFASSGNGAFVDSANNFDLFSWTGKTATTLTGCTGVLAHNNGAVATTGKAFVFSAITNELTLMNSNNTPYVVIGAAYGHGPYSAGGTFGRTDTTYIGVQGLSWDSAGGYFSSEYDYGCVGDTTYGYGLRGDFDEAAGAKGPISLRASTASSAPTHTALRGTLWVTSAGILYINTDSGTTWGKVGAQ